MTINIQLNGQAKKIQAGKTLNDLVIDLDLENIKYAIEINQKIQPKNTYQKIVLQDQDKIEVITAVGGG